MDTIALLSHSTPTVVIAYRAGLPITAQRFLSDAGRLAQSLPAGRHVLNVCADRYRFTVGLAACLITRRVSLLPSTHTPEVIGQLASFAPDAVCLTDDPHCDLGLPLVHYPEELPRGELPWIVPEIPVAQLAAIVFTSGSTGTPLPYKKTWGRLARCVRDGAARLGLSDGRRHVLIGTVPAQHMYGFESTVLLALMSGNSFCAERPFYPADIATALAAVPRPRGGLGQYRRQAQFIRLFERAADCHPRRGRRRVLPARRRHRLHRSGALGRGRGRSHIERGRAHRASAPADRSRVPAAPADHRRALAAQRHRQAAPAGTAAAGKPSPADE